jgi:glycosyltransferase involved in cell wall biosynthesis
VTDPTIAVVIPVHNKERHVVRSLDAAQGQTSPQLIERRLVDL